MGTTANYDLPYPEGSDLVIAGDDAMQTLAEAVDQTLVDMWATDVADIAQADAAITGIPASTEWTATFPGTQDLMAGFSYSAGALTRLGPGRLFMVVAEVTVKSVAASPVNSITSQLTMHVNNGPQIAQSLDFIAHTGTDLSRRDITHRIVRPIALANGDFITFHGLGSAAVEIRQTRLNVYPIGPVEG